MIRSRQGSCHDWCCSGQDAGFTVLCIVIVLPAHSVMVTLLRPQRQLHLSVALEVLGVPCCSMCFARHCSTVTQQAGEDSTGKEEGVKDKGKTKWSMGV